MREKDLREVGRRLDEAEEIHAAGYEPVYAYGEALWLKCHWGSLHTHHGALRDMNEDGRRSARTR